MELSSEQKIVFDKYLARENIFISGPAGVGKGKIIQEIYKHAIENKKRIQVCALTGCAALLLNCKAKTIHSWSGIGIANGYKEDIVERVANNFQKSKNWKSVDILIIDEISMMSLKIFEILNEIAIKVKKRDKIFGGMQIILSGDFYQLPPVGNPLEIETTQFCFESPLWNQMFTKQNSILLVKIFRQNDEKFLKILNEIRDGKMFRSSVNLLKERIGKKVESHIQPTKLFPRRFQVDTYNKMEMDKLSGDDYLFCLSYEMEIPMKEKYSKDQIQRELETIENSLISHKELQLKVGSQVMYTINSETPQGFQLCNGSRGVVTSFNVSGFPIVKFQDGFEIPIEPHIWSSETIPGIGVKHLPLILAWGISIHKSQGMSIDCAEIDVGSDIFECGQTYVALSRVKSLEGLYLTSLDISKIKMNSKVKDFYNQFK